MTICADRLPTAVLLDLDGTLVDSADGILGSLRAAFDELGLPWPEGVIDRGILGPPLYRTLPTIIGAEAAAAVMPVYRRHYAERGLLECTPYPGVDALLRELADAGVRLALATSKAEVYARRMLAERGWDELFAEIVGDTLDAARPTKADVVAEALARLGSPQDAVMVGDRSNDVDGARRNGLDCLGVGWGYGLPGELAEAGAVAIVDSAAELGAVLLPSRTG
ncbi:HAD hydrolase-like protein [Pseudonocardia nigra]|uniref:HAD hydrolase-like protein n=1 Tax=Pseudonocardia nigra TaxID=1921578 RepID=UPI0027E32198|nr:HAD hydrolase-like protein [Pseudonocardia nigra]